MTPARLLISMLLPLVAGQVAPSRSADKVTVMGRVVDSHGTPVGNVLVSAYPPSAEIHQGARTGADGTFRFEVEPFGAGVVTASKPEDGFPDPEFALYGRAAGGVQQINATVAASPVQVELRLEEADAVIAWKVLSRADGSVLTHVSFDVSWSDDPHISIRGGKLAPGGVFKFVLPKHPVQITLGAPGFHEWRSAESREFGGPVLFTPGTRDDRTILLEPLR